MPELSIEIPNSGPEEDIAISYGNAHVQKGGLPLDKDRNGHQQGADANNLDGVHDDESVANEAHPTDHRYESLLFFSIHEVAGPDGSEQHSPE